MRWLLLEQQLSLAEAARRQGKAISTIWRWVRAGVRGHKLESWHIGALRYTSVEAIERFFEATNSSPGTPSPTKSAKQREAAHLAAEQELARDGI